MAAAARSRIVAAPAANSQLAMKGRLIRSFPPMIAAASRGGVIIAPAADQQFPTISTSGVAFFNGAIGYSGIFSLSRVSEWWSRAREWGISRALMGKKSCPTSRLAKIWRVLFFGHEPMNISLPQSLKDFVDRQVASRACRTSSEYVRALIRRDRDRQHLRGLLLDGAASPPAGEADTSWFAELRERAPTR